MEKIRGVLIGGIIGLAIPILIFLLSLFTCTGNNCLDLSYALQPLILISAMTLIIGLCVGFLSTQKAKPLKMTSWIVLALFVLVLIVQSILYFTLPSLEQRGQFGSFLIISLAILLAVNFVLVILSFIKWKAK